MDKQKPDCNYAQIFPNDNKCHCMAYSQSKRKDGRQWCHYPYCSDEACPVKHPELLEDAVLKEKPVSENSAVDGQKPLADWTLGEVKEYCAGTMCSHCGHMDKDTHLCGFRNIPRDWDLTSPPRFTEEEVATMHYICKCYNLNESSVLRRHTKNYLILYGEEIEVHLPSELFPSILPGQSVKLSDIVGIEAD